MANTARKTNKRAARSMTRTKKIVKMIKRPGDIEALDVVHEFIPQERLEKMPAQAQSAVMQMGIGMVELVKAGEYDLRRAMG